MQELSVQACSLLNVPQPVIQIILCAGKDFDGGMHSRYKKEKMYIELKLPHTLKFQKDKLLIAAITIHEHCHYKDSFEMTPKERKKSLDEYLNNQHKRAADEKRTWRCTKKVAKNLGLWTKKFFKEVKTCEYASELTF